MGAKKRHAAYRQVRVTDGLQTWVEHRFDMTQELTPDDLEALRSTRTAGTPEEAVARLTACLDALTDAPPAVEAHAAAIREILGRVRPRLGRMRLSDLDALRRADEHRFRIGLLLDVVPAARKGNEADAKHRRRVVAGLGANARTEEWAEKIRRTIAGNPLASDRRLAAMAGCSASTVRRYRSRAAKK